MERLIVLAASPVCIFLFYIYIRDKYEKEPIWLLFTGLFYGIVASAPVIFAERLLSKFSPNQLRLEVLYDSFIIASFVEEGFKFAVVYFLIRKNKEFNESFDAVVYSVFVSLGFAGVENFFYVFSPELGGVETGILRAVLSVPAHGLFAVQMGYWFSFCRFYLKRKINPLSAFIMAFIWHGMYDFLLLSGFAVSDILFLIFVVYIWISAGLKINKLLQSSPFRKDNLQ